MKKLGLQLYTIRDHMKTEQDIDESFAKLVALGYTEEMAINEARRCLNCKHRPCVSGCPVMVKIPEFIDLIKKGDFEGAYYEAD